MGKRALRILKRALYLHTHAYAHTLTHTLYSHTHAYTHTHFVLHTHACMHTRTHSVFRHTRIHAKHFVYTHTHTHTHFVFTYTHRHFVCRAGLAVYLLYEKQEHKRQKSHTNPQKSLTYLHKSPEFTHTCLRAHPRTHFVFYAGLAVYLLKEKTVACNAALGAIAFGADIAIGLSLCFIGVCLYVCVGSMCVRERERRKGVPLRLVLIWGGYG